MVQSKEILVIVLLGCIGLIVAHMKGCPQYQQVCPPTDFASIIAIYGLLFFSILALVFLPDEAKPMKAKPKEKEG